MRCLVVGGGGFIGSHLSEGLLNSGHAVTVFDREESRYLPLLKEAGAELSLGDYLNDGNIKRALEDQDVVFHLLSTTVPQTSNNDPGFDVETNVLGTLRMLDLARVAGVKKVIFSSSGGTVYGIPQGIPIKENHPTDPTSSYGITKLMIEKFLYLYWTLYRLDYCILRISNAYGERQPVSDTQGVISSFLSKALRHEEISLWGDGSVIRDYVYVGDIVNAFLKALTYNGSTKVFNIGAGEGHSLNDIIEIIEGVVKHPLQVNRTPARVFDVPLNVLDVSSAMAHLGWDPKVGLFEGVARQYAWMKSGKSR